jgi:nicotinamide mononucleotide (NMN) deamidase PncC
MDDVMNPASSLSKALLPLKRLGAFALCLAGIMLAPAIAERARATPAISLTGHAVKAPADASRAAPAGRIAMSWDVKSMQETQRMLNAEAGAGFFLTAPQLASAAAAGADAGAR